VVVPVDDELHVYSAASGSLLTMFSTGGSIAAGAAAIADGKIVVQSGRQYPLGSPSNNNQIHCYGL
jgi:hypothetical protein